MNREGKTLGCLTDGLRRILCAKNTWMTLAVGRRKSDDRSLGVAGDLGCLTMMALPAPVPDVLADTRPNVSCSDKLDQRPGTGMAQAV